MPKTYFIEPTNSSLHGSFSKDYQPILHIESGDSVQYKTVDIDWGYNHKDGSRVQFQSRENENMWGHPITGPIYINHAKPGMTLEVKINDIVPAWYGWNCSGGSTGWHNQMLGFTDEKKVKLDWDLNAETMSGKSKFNDKQLSVALQPFLGLLSNAPSEEGIHSTIPPRYCGGNLDCKELIKGSSLYLPVAVEGALFSVGDGHAAQGDGEVSGQAIECPMDHVDLTFLLHEDMNISMPRANTPSGWVTFGFDEDLNKATIIALEEMLLLIQNLYHVDKLEATALASVVVDLKITQIVNRVKGVHAILPHGAIR